jgi:hypothetical protein
MYFHITQNGINEWHKLLPNIMTAKSMVCCNYSSTILPAEKERKLLLHFCIIRSSRFMPGGLHSWKTSHKSNTKFSFKTVYFLGVSGLRTSSSIMYNYTTSGHTKPVEYTVYILFHTVHRYFYTIYLFISNAIKM